MASPGLELGEVQPPAEPPQPELAFTEAQKWIEQVTGRSFGEKDFRSGLENGILLCELLNAIKPGLVKKINRLPTPIAGLDNIILFLRGCKELGLKESQLFDPGDLQDTSNRATIKNIDYSRKLKNVLVTIYWLGKAANSCTSYSGSTLNLKEFEGFLAQMRKETEDIESPKRSIRDSGYIDCWDSERSDSLSPPRHGRDDSFDSLDSFGSRSQQTPSPDVVLRGSSDGRGSDSETDLPHRKMPDVKKDDMLARRTSHGEPKSAVPFNQYLPNKSNQTFYVPAPLRKKKAEREEYRKSWSTATSPLGDRPFSKPHPETIEEELNETSGLCEKEKVGSMAPEASSLKNQLGVNQSEENSIDQSPSCSAKETSAPKEKDVEEIRKLRRLEQAGIKVMSAAQRYGSKKPICEDSGSTPDIILRKDNPFMTHYQGKDSGSEDEAASRVPDLEKDDFATRRARMNQPKHIVPFNSFLVGPYTSKEKGKPEDVKKPLQMEKKEHARRRRVHMTSVRQTVTSKESPLLQNEKTESEEEQQVKELDNERDDLAKQKSQSILPQLQEDVLFVNASITKADLETWKRLKLSGEPRFGPRTAVSDDAESMSMFDMRCEEDAVAQPHSKARHEKLQNIHNQLKEDETRWQDDLARWKSRRRSASQDLIKKEAERKKMERLLAGDGTNERRKSIKTYREIVEEKERRERELHEAYKNAKTQEEAESILQQYTERFTISEAVLERLQMPKILERSHSVEPNSPLKDPNPLRYLRQQSLPAPKFTATIEATIVPTTELEPSSSTGRTSPSKSISKAVPMLTPKPYSQPKNTQEVLKNFKVDGKVSMNGENVNGTEEKDKECTTVIFTPSPTRSLKFDGVARGDKSPAELKKEPPSVELSLQRPATQSVHKEPTASPVELDGADSLQAEPSPSSVTPAPPECPSPDQKQFKSTAACSSPVVKRLEFLPSPVPSEENASSKKDVKKAETEQQKETELPSTQEAIKVKALEEKGSVVLPFLKKLPETSQVTLHNSSLQADSDTGDKSNRFNFWSWDPEEERKRQERWQHEQERLLQEKYQKEQYKLKEEWEKAQREVEEEERRYYEEERKIIEDTVVPFIVSSNSAELLSSSSSTTEGNKTVSSIDSNSCPGEGKQKEITKQKKLLWEQDSMSSLKSKESELWQEKRSGNKVLSGYPATGILKGGSEQEHHMPVMERGSPARLNLPLAQDDNVSWNQQLLTKRSPQCAEDVRQRPFLGQTVGQQPSSAGEARRAGYHENFRSGPSSPCSPAALSQSPNRSVSGKKLCSTCGLPLGKGAAMIIETLGLYFHIQCFRCGVCKGQLGDAASGTDVRIRNGLLNCNDCYIRSRTAGQPTTL
ncbi:LIM and calponin homology domains-containing protein 1 isoform X5 [Pyrgilauda ruficollis]|uniref:LIM and calponin homology domains-containing protein 1 isoform X5 n=1 Tax=Pyrgilauda ruficollis TaxID=221976 RepID=UPI001B882A6F|nr:LIM and calponin homology domains-containing protein 1 isoform X5 [Pyrgilauda ruficollis]